MAVNKIRSSNEKLKNVRFLSWYQDVFPETYSNMIFNKGDILYLLGTAEQLGLNINNIKVLNQIDFSTSDNYFTDRI
mgnify:CR=1 FL=1